MKTTLVSLGLALIAVAAVAAPTRTQRPVAERLVTLQVKDAPVEDVIRALKKQCGVKNVVIDPDVSGRASFFFRDLPCGAAWTTVLRTYGLTVAEYSPSVIHVETRR